MDVTSDPLIGGTSGFGHEQHLRADGRGADGGRQDQRDRADEAVEREPDRSRRQGAGTAASVTSRSVPPTTISR